MVRFIFDSARRDTDEEHIQRKVSRVDIGLLGQRKRDQKQDGKTGAKETHEH